MNSFYLIGIFIFSYLIGSIPFAYLLAKILYKTDLRAFGTGDVGALNFYRLKKNFILSSIIVILDLMKGMAPVWLAIQYQSSNFNLTALTVGGVLLGDVFPVWLNFRGSRGLNVAAGALLMVDPRLVIIWLAGFIVFYLVIRQHIIAILISTFGLPLVVFFARHIYFTDNTLILILLIAVLIFQRHLERVPDLVEQKRLKIKKGEKR